MLTIFQNIIQGNITTRFRDGRPFLIAPVILISAGVLCGSLGCLLHEPETLNSYPQAWSGIAVTNNHPKDSMNRPISANDPEILSKQMVGRLFDVQYDQNNESLVGEMWIDVLRSDEVNRDILTKLRTGMLEVSTGMYHDVEQRSGSYNGKSFDAGQDDANFSERHWNTSFSVWGILVSVQQNGVERKVFSEIKFYFRLEPASGWRHEL